MTVLRRRTGIASVAALGGLALAVAAHAVAPDWSRRTGLDVWHLAALEDEYAAEEARWNQLVATHEHLECQVAASDHVVARLIAGELTLVAAAEELEQINADRGGFDAALAVRFPKAPTPRARVARYAVGKADRKLASDPSRQGEVLARLEAEYREMTNEQ